MEEDSEIHEWNPEEEEENVQGTVEETKEGLDDSTLVTIKRIQICCNTMVEFRRQGMEIKDIAIRAREYLKTLIGAEETTDMDNKNNRSMVIDLMSDEDEGNVI